MQIFTVSWALPVAICCKGNGEKQKEKSTNLKMTDVKINDNSVQITGY